MADTGRGPDFEAVRCAGQGVFSLGDAERAGISRSAVRWALRVGQLVRLRHGVYTTTSYFEQCSERRRHWLVVQAEQRINPALVACSLSAAAVLGLPLPSVPSKPLLRPLRPGEACRRPSAGPAMTTVARTVLDCARRVGREWGLAVADAAIAQRFVRCSRLQELAATLSGPGSASARWVAQHARNDIESPLESLARAVIILDRLPEPAAQRWISTSRGRYRVDLLDELNRVITEADGKVKYDTRQSIWLEKRREDALRDCGFEVVRFTMYDYHHRQEWLAGYRRAIARGQRRGGMPS